MSLKKHLRRFRTEVMICARCDYEYTFSKSDYNFYKTKQAILKANGWHEFSDKPKPYLLCDDCSFFRKYHGLLFSIDNVLQTTTSYHYLKEVTDDHKSELCELCLAIRRTTFLIKDFKDYLTSRPSFFYLEKPPKKSSFDDSYGLLSDAEIAISQKASALIESATSPGKSLKGQNQLKHIGQVTTALPNLPKLPNSFINIKPASKMVLDEINRNVTEKNEAKLTEISISETLIDQVVIDEEAINTHATPISEILTDQVVTEQAVIYEEKINSHAIPISETLTDQVVIDEEASELWDEDDAGWGVIEIHHEVQDITISNQDDNLLAKEKELESQLIPNSLLNEISDNAHDQPINGQQTLLDTRKSKHNFCLPKRANLNNAGVEAKIHAHEPTVLSLLLIVLSSLALGMFFLILSFVLIHLFSQS